MTEWIISGVLGFAGGFAACWFGKEKLTIWYKGAEDYIGSLEDKVRALKAKL